MDATFPCRKIGANIIAMPELPEVEVIRRGLSPLLIGRTIRSVELFRSDLRYPLPQQMSAVLTGRRFTTVGRRGKYLLFSLDGDRVLLWHLGMTGQFHLLASHTAPVKHEHVRIRLDDGNALCYRDSRRFGYAGLTTRDELGDHPWLTHFGPEPLGPDFNADYLWSCCKGRKAPVKNVLMDTKVVVGVGNIYASESLFRSGIHPARLAGKVSKTRLAILVERVRQVLGEAIDAGGSTISDFVKADGRPGYFAHQFRVYGREGMPCHACGRPIRRTVQGGRSTFFCPGCQR